MKLAEALTLRKDLMTRMNELRGRLQRSAVTAEGDEPPERIPQLLEELEDAVDQYADIIQRINKTNTATPLAPYGTLTDALALRDAFKFHHPIIEFLIAHTANALNQHRQRATELRSINHVNVAELQKRLDKMSGDRRLLDNRIQEANWLTELL